MHSQIGFQNLSGKRFFGSRLLKFKIIEGTGVRKVSDVEQRKCDIHSDTSCPRTEPRHTTNSACAPSYPRTNIGVKINQHLLVPVFHSSLLSSLSPFPSSLLSFSEKSKAQLSSLVTINKYQLSKTHFRTSSPSYPRPTYHPKFF